MYNHLQTDSKYQKKKSTNDKKRKNKTRKKHTYPQYFTRRPCFPPYEHDVLYSFKCQPPQHMPSGTYRLTLSNPPDCFPNANIRQFPKSSHRIQYLSRSNWPNFYLLSLSLLLLLAELSIFVHIFLRLLLFPNIYSRRAFATLSSSARPPVNKHKQREKKGNNRLDFFFKQRRKKKKKELAYKFPPIRHRTHDHRKS